jgi:hypothetical protein
MLLDGTAKTQVQPNSGLQSSPVTMLGPEQGLSGTVSGGPLEPPTRNALETALNEEINEHLGYECITLSGVEDGQFVTSHAHSRQVGASAPTGRTVD